VRADRDRLRLPARALAAAGALVLAGCFEEPVEERLTLCFLADGTLVMTASTETSAVSTDGNAALQGRMAETRRAIEEGRDAWRRRFRAAEPAAERVTIDLDGGEVRSARRSAVLIQPDGLRRFFAETGISAFLDAGPTREEAGAAPASGPAEPTPAAAAERHELSITPGAPTRANQEQRRQALEALDRWSELLARYLADAGALYRYVGDHPERATACLSVVLSGATRKPGEELAEGERPLVDALTGDMNEAVKLFDVPETEAYTPNELSHLVWDPFPARIEVRVDGDVHDVEGFRRQADGSLAVAGLGLWEAWETLEDRWVAPDPLLVSVRAQRRGGEPLDLAAFVALPRRAEPPPDPAAVRREVTRALTPAPLYRVAWTPSAPPWATGEGPELWDEVRCP
jgi:hypothetical protein